MSREKLDVPLTDFAFDCSKCSVPMKYMERSDLIITAMKVLMRGSCVKGESILISGYEEMSQINLSLAEVGLEEDTLDLILYEARLTGRGRK